MDIDPFVRVPYADRCVDCLTHVVEPTVLHRENGQAECLYRCPCGATWQCAWSVGAVEDWAVLGDAA